MFQIIEKVKFVKKILVGIAVLLAIALLFFVLK